MVRDVELILLPCLANSDNYFVIISDVQKCVDKHILAKKVLVKIASFSHLCGSGKTDPV